jgi:hypothetical protein
VSKIEVLTPLEMHKVYISEEHLGEMLKLLTQENSQPVAMRQTWEERVAV